MKTNEDFLKFFEKEKSKLIFIESMKPEYQPEYYLRKGYFAHNDELAELREKVGVDLHSALERIKDLDVYILDLRKALGSVTKDLIDCGFDSSFKKEYNIIVAIRKRFGLDDK